MSKRNKHFKTDEERYYLTWAFDSKNPQARAWMRRTVIFHYSNGTNKCSVEGCNAPVDVLTLEHENFDKYELANKLNYKTATSGNNLAYALLLRGFPYVNITVKCMAHNQNNHNPRQGINTSKNHPRLRNRDHIDQNLMQKCRVCKEVKNQVEFALHKDKLLKTCKVCDNMRRISNNKDTLRKAYELYGYIGELEFMTWEHANNDGNLHRQYLANKYNLKNSQNICSTVLAGLLLREHKAGIPNWPGLVVMHANDNHIGRKQYLTNNRKETTINDKTQNNT